MNLFSTPNPIIREPGKHENQLNNRVNYISKGHLVFQGIQNNTWYFLKKGQNELKSFCAFSLRRSIKFMRKQFVEKGVLTLMNKSNQFIVQNWQLIQIFSLEKFSTQKIITKFEELEANKNYQLYGYDEFAKQESQVLNANDDLFVVTNRYKDLNFWQKTDDDNWICQQTIASPWYSLRNLKFNDEGTLLIATLDSEDRLIIFKKHLNQQWEIIDEIQIQQARQFCFLSNQIFAYIELQKPVIVFWEVSSFTQKANRLQMLELQSANQGLFNQCRYISYSQSKDVLLAFNLGIFYKIMKNKEGYYIFQKFYIQNHPINVTCCNKGELLLSSYLTLGEINKSKIIFQSM